jgi:hypothetical protein
MSTYNPFTGSATGVTNGRGVPRCHLSKRLNLAAAAVLGWAPLQPTITQAVRDFNVPHAALKQRIERFRAREANGNGPAPVAVAPAAEAAGTEETSDATVDTMTVTPVAEETNGSAGESLETVRIGGYTRFLVEELLDATPKERVEVARGLGVDWVWEHLIMAYWRSSAND